MKKKASTLLCILAIFFGVVIGIPLTANAAEDDNEEMMKKTAAILLENCVSSDEDSAAQMMELRDVYLDYILVQTGIAVEAKEYKDILKAWRDGIKECGEYADNADVMELLSDFSFRTQGTSVFLEGSVHFKNREATITFEFKNDGSAKSLTISGHYSISESATRAGMNTFIGMVTVFAVLIFMSIVIWILGSIGKKIVKREETQKASSAVVNETTTVEEDEILHAIIAAVIEEEMRQKNRWIRR